MSRRAFRICLELLGLFTFVGIGGLQMFRINAGYLTSHGADLLGPIVLYFVAREGVRLPGMAWRWRFSPGASFFCVGLGCFTWEWCQRYDFSGTPLVITHGTFDPNDLAAYTAGLLLAYSLDVGWLQPRGVTLPAGRVSQATPPNASVG